MEKSPIRKNDDHHGSVSSNESFVNRESLRYESGSLAELVISGEHDHDENDTDSFIVGDRVWVGSSMKPGVIAFIGETQFGPGDWAGIVLDEPSGKNDGSVAGVRYFQCPRNRGVFTRLSRLRRSPGGGDGDNNASLESATYSTPMSGRASAAGSICGSVSRMATASLSTNLIVGDRVLVRSGVGTKTGVLEYYGATEFSAGLWCGVRLDEPVGKNDGSVNGVRYFECGPNFGLFVTPEKVNRSCVSAPKKTKSTWSSSGGGRAVVQTAAAAGGISRQGTLDSLRSIKTIESITDASPAASSLTRRIREPAQQQMQRFLREREFDREQIKKAAAQVDHAEKQLLILRDQYDVMCSQSELETNSLRRTIEELQRDNNELRQSLDDERRKVEELVFSFEEESITKSEIQVLNEEYEQKLKHLEEAIAAAKEADKLSANRDRRIMSSSSSENDGIQPELSFEEKALKQRLARLKEENSSLTNYENQCKTLKQRLDTLEEENSSLKSYETECKTLEQNLATFRKENSLLKNYETECKTLKQSLAILQEKNSSLKNCKTECKVLQQSLAKLQEENNSLRQYETERKILQQNLVSLQEKDNSFKNNETKYRAFQQSLAMLQEENSSLKHYETERKTLKQSLATLEEEINSLKNHEADCELKQNLAMLQEENSSLKNYETECKILKQSVASLQEENNSFKNDETECKLLKQNLATLRDENSSLKNCKIECKSLKQSLTTPQKQNSSLTNYETECKTLKQSLTTLQEENSSLRNELSRLQRLLQLKVDEFEKKLLSWETKERISDEELTGLRRSVVEMSQQKDSPFEFVNSYTHRSTNTSGSFGIPCAQQVEKQYRDEVNFLNSVIIDLQRKNQDLHERLRYLEEIIPPHLLKPKKVVAPRLFCDICDLFDAHDTEDCNKEESGDSPLPPRRRRRSSSSSTAAKRSSPPPPRPYCELCEVFGHVTKAECHSDNV